MKVYFEVGPRRGCKNGTPNALVIFRLRCSRTRDMLVYQSFAPQYSQYCPLPAGAPQDGQASGAEPGLIVSVIPEESDTEAVESDAVDP